MIDAAFCRMMARYNAWQNNSLVGAAKELNEDARQLDRGAFFGSIHRTFSHLLLGDTIWISRFDGGAGLDPDLVDGPVLTLGWTAFKAARDQMDIRITAWAEAVSDAQLSEDMTWYSGGFQRHFTQPVALCVTHFFNHQTHHRGQVHAMLTAAAARPDDTDLIYMPGAA